MSQNLTPQHIPARKTALLVSCMDLRLIDNLVKFMDGDNMTNRYDQFIAAGTSLCLIKTTPKKYKSWRPTFLKHLEWACNLHDIHDVYIMEHRNCGAYAEVLKEKGTFGTGEEDQIKEEDAHKKYAFQLKKEIEKWAKDKNRDLTVQCFLMDLRGNVKFLSDVTSNPA